MKDHPPRYGVIRMAQKIQTLFIDDIDGSEADGTVRFGLDGAEYEIDLNSKHDEELRVRPQDLHCPRPQGQRTGPQGTAGRTGRKPSAVDTVAVRAWARENGHDIKDRERVRPTSSPSTGKPPVG